MSDVVLDPLRWESVEAGDSARIECWLAAEGDVVHAGQPLGRAALAHERLDIAAPHDGVLEEILVAPGERFAPGSVLARVIDI